MIYTLPVEFIVECTDKETGLTLEDIASALEIHGYRVENINHVNEVTMQTTNDKFKLFVKRTKDYCDNCNCGKAEGKYVIEGCGG